jgi:hypothetical protein
MKKIFAALIITAAGMWTAQCSLTTPTHYDPDAGDTSLDDGTDRDTNVDQDLPPDGVDGEDGEDVPPACPEGMERCGDECFDLDTDPDHCGSCDTVCSPDRECTGGICVCREGLTECGETCVDIASNPNHCGGCDRACEEGWVCSEGICSLECGEGLTNCDGACLDLMNDPMHCGDCDRICPTAVGADPVCNAGVCGLECRENRWDIDGDPGCEYECVFVSADEACNGDDDNCNGAADEGFDCAAGEPVECLSACGTSGSGVCTDDCQFPTGNACTPPDEVCNGVDDDCDGVCDNGFDCCRGMADLECVTACGTEGISTCSATCVLSPCCAASEICGNGCDDNCDGSVDEGCGPPNDTCDGAIDVTAGGRFTGITAGAANDSNPPSGCGAMNGGSDVYFSFTIRSPSDVFISSLGSSFDTVLYVGSECGGGGLGCNNNVASPTILQSLLRMRNPANGTYYITLDGNGSGAAGDYVLDVYITPMDDPSDKCGHVVPFDDVATGESGTTCGYDNDYTGSCTVSPSTPANDRVYFIVIPNGLPSRTVTFSTCNSDTTGTYDTLLYIRNVCNDAVSEFACSDDDPACTSYSFKSSVSADLGPGMYYLFMDGYSGCGNYRITVSGL